MKLLLNVDNQLDVRAVEILGGWRPIFAWRPRRTILGNLLWMRKGWRVHKLKQSRVVAEYATQKEFALMVLAGTVGGDSILWRVDLR